MGGSNQTQQVSTTTPTAAANKNINLGLKDAETLYKAGDLAPVAGMNDNTKTGLQSVLSQAQAGQGGLSAAYSSLSDIAGGKYLNQSDPNYERLRSRALSDASTEASMVASGMGRSGSDFHQSSVAQTVGDLAAQMDYGRYQDERANQMNAINALPGMFDATLSPGYAMSDVGSAFQNQAQQEAGAKANNLFALLQSAGVAAPYATTTTTQAQPRNTLGALLGGGLGLASLFR